jgi:hypothetical protein
VTDRHSLTRRTFALALAAVLTLAPLFALHFRGSGSKAPTSPERISYLDFPSSPPSAKELAPAFVPAKPRIAASENRRAQGPKAMPQPADSDSSGPAAIHETQQVQAAVIETPELPASAPIRLDAATIRAANHASKSEVRKMAAVSGTYVGDDPVSESDKLAGAITRIAKEDCLAPNPGGSILSVLVIVYQAARSKCK